MFGYRPVYLSRHLNNVRETNKLKIFPRFSVSPNCFVYFRAHTRTSAYCSWICTWFFVCVQCRYPILSSKFLHNSILILYSGCSALKRFVVPLHLRSSSSPSPSSVSISDSPQSSANVFKYLLWYGCTFAFSLACSSMEN
jgi:hypothetical protein